MFATMYRRSLFLVVSSLILSSTLGDQIANVSSEIHIGNEAEPRPEVSPKVYKVKETSRVSIEDNLRNSSSLMDENEKPRDKRALGVILQGLAEAFGYTVSPISIAVLPNPNTTAATAAAAPPTIFTFPGIATPPPAPPAPARRPNPPAQPPQRPQKPLPPTITATMTPRQKETLRFTGVVNFGNNSDLAGHLRRYEQIFHGAATTTAAPPPPRPPPTSGSTKLGLLPPFFVKIPLPIAPNLPPLLPPSAPRKTKQMSYTETYESGEITDEKDVRTSPPQGHRDTYVDEPEWLKKERQQQKNEYREDDSSEETEQSGRPNEYHETAEREREESRDKERDKSEEEEEEDNSQETDQKNHYKENEENDERRNEDEEDSRERHETKKPLLIKYTKGSEENERDNDAADYESDEEESEHERYKGNANNQDSTTTLKKNLSNFDDSFDFVAQTKPSVPKQFGTGLPIRVFDVPFNGQGAFRNSYGQSLEHDGRTDDSLADYFQRYKHPETGLFDSEKILNLEAPQRREIWWQDQPEVRRAAEDPLRQIRQEYGQKTKRKYEDHDHNDDPGKQKAPRRQNTRKKNRKGILKDEEVAEPTMTTYAQVKAPKIMKKRSDVEKADNDEKRPRRSKARGNLKLAATRRISKIKRNESANSPSSKSFDIVQYNPYFRPLQIAYEPAKLRRTAARILSYHNFDENGEIVEAAKITTTATNDDEEEEDSSERSVNRSNTESQTKPEAATPEKRTGRPRHRNQYPLRDAYKPESLQKTPGRIPSYRHSGHSKRKPEENREDAREEAEEEPEEPEVRYSSTNSREDEEESKVRTSSENLREEEEKEPEVRGSRGRLREQEDEEDKSEENDSPEDLKEREAGRDESKADDESSENLQDRESEEGEPDVDRAPENARRPGEEETARDRSSEDSKEAYHQEPEEYRSAEDPRERYYQDPEDRDSEERPREDHQELKVYRCSDESQENCDDEANRRSENSRANKESQSTSETLRESHDEPEDDHPAEELREVHDEEPKTNRFSEKLQEPYHDAPEVGLPERLTGAKLHEGESKVFQGWPAPFDYTFDSTESTKTLQYPNYSEIPYENVAPTHLAPAIYKQYHIRTSGDNPTSFPANVPPTYGTPSIIELRTPTNAGTYYRDLTIAPTDESLTYVIPPYHQLPDNRQNEPNQPEDVTGYYKNPEPSYQQPFTVQNALQQTQYPPLAYQKSLENASRGQESPEQSELYVPEGAGDLPTRRQQESPRGPEETGHGNKADGRAREISREPLPLGLRTFDGPESAHEFFGLSPDDYELEGQKFGQRKTDNNVPPTNTTPLDPNSDKLIELLVVKQDDPNYRKDVVLTEFTDKPETDTEKVRVKEYRNTVATIQVSEEKQLSPDGPVQLDKRRDAERREELENKMTEILDNLKTRLTVE